MARSQSALVCPECGGSLVGEAPTVDGSTVFVCYVCYPEKVIPVQRFVLDTGHRPGPGRARVVSIPATTDRLTPER